MTPSDKAAIVHRVRAAQSDGLSLRSACAMLGQSPASVLRWMKALDAAGNAWDAFAPKKPTGRPPVVLFSDEELAIARWHRLCKRSLEVAIYFFLIDPGVSPETKAAMRAIEERALENGKAASWPDSVMRAFHVTADQKAKFRGPKAEQNTEMVTRRGHLWVDEDGTVHDLLAGELWELDDYSCNEPFTFPDLSSGDFVVGRQTLAARDLVSAGWLGFDLIGRSRDAYRGEDIVRYLGRLFRSHGLPRFLRLERGVWESASVHGIEVPGMTRRWGGLDELVTIRHVYKSKAKGLIEGGFDELQNWLAHAGRSLGRHAGEFQESARAHRQVKSAVGLVNPQLVGFWTQAQASEAHAEVARILNAKPRNRKAIGQRISADDLIARQGWNTMPLPASEAWRLLPFKKRTVIRGGHVIVNPGGGWNELEFTVNGQDGLHLENGHAVLVACDPLDPSAGAYIANADQSPRNRNGWSIGQCLLSAAPLAPVAPQIDLSGRKHASISLRKAASAAAVTDFRSVRAGAPNLRESAAADGNGNSALAGSLQPIDRAAIEPVMPPPTGRSGLAALPPVSRSTPASKVSRDTHEERSERLRRMEEAAKQSF